MPDSLRVNICDTLNHLIGPTLQIRLCGACTIPVDVFFEIAVGIVLELNVFLLGPIDKHLAIRRWLPKMR